MDKIYYEKNAASFGLKIGHRGFDPVFQQQTAFQEILIAETQKYGRTLFLDGVIQSTEADEAIYHDMLIHPVMAHVENPAHILVAGAGEGASLRELLKYSCVEAVDAVEIDGDMIRAAADHLPDWHKGAFTDSRVTLIEEDILKHLADHAGGYDVIIVDLTDPIGADGEFCAESLTFDPKFLALLKAKLNPGGCIAMQVGVRTQALARIFPSLRERFAWLHPYSVFVPSFHDNWTFLLLATDNKSEQQKTLEATLEDTEKQANGYFSKLAFLHASEQAARLFKG